MKTPKRLILGLVTLAVMSTPMVASHAALEDGEPVAQEAFQATVGLLDSTLENQLSTQIVLTDNRGSHVVQTTVGAKLGEVMEENNFIPKDYRTEEGERLDLAMTLTDEPLFLFRSAYSGKTEKVELAPPVIEVENPMLAKGSEIVEDEGEPGLGLRTSLVLEDLSASEVNRGSSDRKDRPLQQMESFIVVKSPKPKKVQVGTREDSEPLTDSDYPAATTNCSNGSSVTDGVQMEIKMIHSLVCSKFPDITIYGTFRNSCQYSCDHRDGYAVDIMVSGDRGWEVAEYLRLHYKELKISYLIYSQKIWADYRQYWKPMSDRGSITANHYDHVHVSLRR